MGKIMLLGILINRLLKVFLAGRYKFGLWIGKINKGGSFLTSCLKCSCLRFQFEVKYCYIFVVCRPLLLFFILYFVIILINFGDNTIFCAEQDRIADVEFDENGKVVRIGQWSRESFLNPTPRVQKGIVVPLEREDYIQMCMEVKNSFVQFPEQRILGSCVNDWEKFFDLTLDPFFVNHKEGFRDLYDTPEYHVYWREEIKDNIIYLLSKDSNRVGDCECFGLKMVPSKHKYYPRRFF